MRSLRYLIILLAALLITGCWDRTELEDVGYIAAVGMDKGVNGGITVTFQIANPQVGSSDIGKAEREPPSQIITFEAPDILTARDTANSAFTRRLTFAHTKNFIISEEMARSEEFYKIFDDLMRDRDIRGQANIIICREKASEFINANKPPMETRPHKFYSLMTLRWQQTGLVPISTVQRFMQRTSAEESLFEAIYGTTEKSKDTKYGEEDKYLPGQIAMKGGDPIQLIGSAVFKEGKMIGTMTGEETRTTLVIRKDYKLSEILVSYPDPLDAGYRISAKLFTKGKPKVNMDLKASPAKVSVNVPVEIEIINIPSLMNYVEDMDNQNKLKQAIESNLEEKAGKLIKRAQEEFKGDLFQWGLEARKKFLTYEEYKKYDWMKSYPEAEVNVHFDVKLRSFGKQLRPPNIPKL